MRLWTDIRARHKLFGRLFQGKLTSGIDSPSDFEPNYGAVLDENYPDLFNGMQWSDDGLTLHFNQTTNGEVLEVRGRNQPGLEVNFYIGGAHMGSARYDDSGNLDHEFVVPSEHIPGIVQTTIKNKNGVIDSYQNFRVGCGDRFPIQPSIERDEFATVVSGDSLWRISESYTGRGLNYLDLLNANRDTIIDQDLIFPGQKLRLPWFGELSIMMASERIQ